MALDGGKVASATSLAELKDAKIGVQVGTTSLNAVRRSSSPTTEPNVYNEQIDAISALKNKQIDALVVDLPTAFYVTAAQVEDSKIVGQFSATGGTPEEFGLVMEKGQRAQAVRRQGRRRPQVQGRAGQDRAAVAERGGGRAGAEVTAGSTGSRASGSTSASGSAGPRAAARPRSPPPRRSSSSSWSCGSSPTRPAGPGCRRSSSTRRCSSGRCRTCSTASCSTSRSS